MANRRNRPQIPYEGTIRPYYNRYKDLAENRQNLTGEQLDGDIDYVIDVLNEHDDDISGVVAGAIPGSTLPENQHKFVTTNGEDPATIFFSKVTANYLAENSVSSDALQNGCATSGKIGDGAITQSKYGPESIPTEAYKDDSIPPNSIPNNSVPFDKIQNAQNDHFVDFFNSQTNRSLSGSKIEADSIPGSSIAQNTIDETRYAAGSVSQRALAHGLGIQVGMIMFWCNYGGFAGGYLPPGWLFCNHAAVSRVKYAQLFNAVGIIFGSGDGSTTFNLPDTAGLVAVSCNPALNGYPGFSGGRVTNLDYLIGVKFGEEKHTLTEQEMPAHTHTVPRGAQLTVNGNLANVKSPESYTQRTETDTSSSVGGGQPHNNLQPSIFLPLIIYTGVFD